MRASSTRRSQLGALVCVFALVGSVAVRAEVVSVPSTDPPNSAASSPPPTVLRGSPPSTDRPVPICPPGYALSPGYGCVGPSGGDDAEDRSGYVYWPGYGYDYPFGFAGRGFGAGRFHRFAGFNGFHRFSAFHNGRAFHARAGFHGSAGFHSFGVGVGHAGGFGRR